MCPNYKEKRILFLMEKFNVDREAAERIYHNALYGVNKDANAITYVLLGKF